MITRALKYQTHNGLGVVQVATSDQDSFSYMCVDQAIGKNMIEIVELSEGGSVNSLFVVNKSAEFVFFMDGDILAGAKQNRVVNTSILVPPESKTRIPVSCVEQGRWRFVSRKFSGTDYSAPSILRAEKARQVHSNLKAKRGHSADQGEIWEMVGDYQASRAAHSPTSNLSDMYDAEMKSLASLSSAFTPDPGANGLAVFIGGKLAGVDIFNRRDVFQHYAPKIIRGAAFEWQGVKGAKLTDPEARYRAVEFIDNLEGLPAEDYQGVGVGTEKRFQSGDVTGLTLQYGGRLVHLTAFAVGKKRKPAQGGTVGT